MQTFGRVWGKAWRRGVVGGVLLAGLLVGCRDSSQPSLLKIGVTAGPHAQILACVQAQAHQEGIPFEIVEFQDFILPNRALAEGSLQANSYQHRPFLNEQIRQYGYPFVIMGETVVMPLGIYTQKALPAASMAAEVKTVAIPNDPTNAGRALRLLEAAGLLTLKEGVVLPSIIDITQNPLQIKIQELEAPQLPRALGDVDIAVINMDWALLSGVDPETAIFCEPTTDATYTNVLVVRAQDQDHPQLQRIAQLYHSEITQAFIAETFRGAIQIPAAARAAYE